MSGILYKSMATRNFLQQSKKLWNCFSNVRSRCCSTTPTEGPVRPKKTIMPLPPMTQAVEGLPTPIYSNMREDDQVTKVTTLSNGLRVASEQKFGEFCTVGVVIDSGCRYEVAYPSGMSHFLEKLAFNSTVDYPDKEDILTKLEKHGGICDSQASRDTFIYAASAYTSGLSDVIHLIADVTLRSHITDEEVELARQTVNFELESLKMRPEQETLLTDMLHAAAYRDNTLGLPKLCPQENLQKIDRDLLYTFISQHFTPERMVVAGVGVEHEHLVEYVQKYFVDIKPIWETNTNILKPHKDLTVDNSVAQYTGGLVRDDCDVPQFAAAGLPILSHAMLGLEACSHQDPDFIPMCVLNMMMGGGGSFSAGGPGKGMYSRLYTNVLNRFHWMFNATAYNHAYSDTGLFCIHASAPPDNVMEMIVVLVKEIIGMSNNVDHEELQRAKTQLKSMLLMNLESRPVVFEDIGRQVLATGERKRPQYFIEEIDKITKDDIARVVRRLMQSPPSVAARGDLRKLPSMEAIQTALLEGENKLFTHKKFALFR